MGKITAGLMRQTPRTNGSFRWKDGSTYEGEVWSGQPDGYGVYTWPDEDKYTGLWEKGKRQGLGCQSRKNGFIFIGEFQNNVPHGEGFYVGPDGICYSGFWANGKQQGEGLLRDRMEGVLYFGPWEQGFPKTDKFTD